MIYQKGMPIYRKDGWILCLCIACEALNYVETHGITAACITCQARTRSRDWTEHRAIPLRYRDASGLYLIWNPKH